MHHLHHQIGGTDAAADQSGIEHDGFHKTILGAAKHLILFRLLHTSGRVGSGIDEDAVPVAVHEQSGHTGENAVEDLLPVRLHLNLHIGNEALRHLSGVRRKIRLLNFHKMLQQLLHQFILAEAVDKIKTGIPPADPDFPPDQVEAPFRLQTAVQPLPVFLQ